MLLLFLVLLAIMLLLYGIGTSRQEWIDEDEYGDRNAPQDGE